MWPDVLVGVGGWLSDEEADFLRGLAAECAGDIVEIGAYHGRSTIALAWGAQTRGAVVYSIDPHLEHVQGGITFTHEDGAIYLRHLIDAGVLDIVKPVMLPSALVKPIPSAGLVFIDGDHAYAAVKADFETFAEGARADVIAVLHDSTGAWEGPTRVAREKAASGWDIVRQFGYSTVLRRATGYATE